jgi:OOP family OmpA-OmpF porin
MRSKIALLGVAALALAASGAGFSAQAQTDGWYAGLMGGVNFLQDADVSGGGVNAKVDFGTGYAGLANVGYGWGKYRLEAELARRFNDADSISGSNTTVGTGALSGDVTVWSGMVNALYDIPIGAFPVQPYVGAGIGVADVSANSVRRSSGFVDDNSVQFAYQGIAGLGWNIDSNWRANLDYRYFATLDPSFVTGTNVNVEGEYRSHAVMLGFAYKFGQPKPAPAPAAKPIAAPAPQPAPPPAPAAVAPRAPRNFIVFFDFDKSNITPEAQKIIEQAAASYKQGNLTRVELTGHADRSGANKYNQALSLRRAKAVEAALAKLGVPQSNIGVTGKGEEQPLVPTADGVREPQNRRVEIVLP